MQLQLQNRELSDYSFLFSVRATKSTEVSVNNPENISIQISVLLKIPQIRLWFIDYLSQSNGEH